MLYPLLMQFSRLHIFTRINQLAADLPIGENLSAPWFAVGAPPYTIDHDGRRQTITCFPLAQLLLGSKVHGQRSRILVPSVHISGNQSKRMTITNRYKNNYAKTFAKCFPDTCFSSILGLAYSLIVETIPPPQICHEILDFCTS